MARPFLLFVLVLACLAACDGGGQPTKAPSAKTAPVKIYKDYVYGQAEAEIAALPGVAACGNGVYCLRGQTFAGYVWLQVFAFKGGRLHSVLLSRAASPACLLGTMTELVGGGFTPVSLWSSGQPVDLVAVAAEQGGEAVAAAVERFRRQTPASEASCYLFAPKSVVFAGDAHNMYDVLSAPKSDIPAVIVEVSPKSGAPTITVLFRVWARADNESLGHGAPNRLGSS